MPEPGRHAPGAPVTDRGSRVRETLVRAVAGGLYHTRLLELSRRMVDRVSLRVGPRGPVPPYLRLRQRPSAQVLLYHQVNDGGDPYYPPTPVRVFERQMAFLASRYTVLPLAELVEALKAGALPRNAVSVTIDDGYRDNLTNAFPILKRYGIPATIFLATGAIGTGALLWHDRVFAAFRETRAPALVRFGPSEIDGALTTVDERLRVQRAVLGFLRSLNAPDRDRWIDRLVADLRVENRRETPGLMLSWEDVRAMRREGISFGAHSVAHPILSRISDEEVRREVIESKAAIETALNSPVTGFAYPNGTADDFDERTKAILREVGYTHAVTTIPGTADSTRDPFEIPRATPWGDDLYTFAIRLQYYKFRD